MNKEKFLLDLASALAGLPVVMTTVREDVARDIEGKCETLFPLKLQNNLI